MTPYEQAVHDVINHATKTPKMTYRQITAPLIKSLATLCHMANSRPGTSLTEIVEQLHHSLDVEVTRRSVKKEDA